MTVERRFSASFREADTDEPGLVLEDDGSVWLIDASGARTQLGGSAPPDSSVCHVRQCPRTCLAGLPQGASSHFYINTATAATKNPYNMRALLNIVRIA